MKTEKELSAALVKAAREYHAHYVAAVDIDSRVMQSLDKLLRQVIEIFDDGDVISERMIEDA
jgi:hypothetical protein